MLCHSQMAMGMSILAICRSKNLTVSHVGNKKTYTGPLVSPAETRVWTTTRWAKNEQKILYSKSNTCTQGTVSVNGLIVNIKLFCIHYS